MPPTAWGGAFFDPRSFNGESVAVFRPRSGVPPKNLCGICARLSVRRPNAGKNKGIREAACALTKGALCFELQMSDCDDYRRLAVPRAKDTNDWTWPAHRAWMPHGQPRFSDLRTTSD